MKPLLTQGGVFEVTVITLLTRLLLLGLPIKVRPVNALALLLRGLLLLLGLPIKVRPVNALALLLRGLLLRLGPI